MADIVLNILGTLLDGLLTSFASTRTVFSAECGAACCPCAAPCCSEEAGWDSIPEDEEEERGGSASPQMGRGLGRYGTIDEGGMQGRRTERVLREPGRQRGIGS